MSANGSEHPFSRSIRIGAAFGLSGLGLAVAGVFAHGAPAPPHPASNSVAASASSATILPKFSSAQIKLFETEVQPLLQANCLSCHGDPGAASGGLLLNSRKAVLRGGASGPAVSLSSPLSSLIIRAVNYDGRQMPPSGKLNTNQIELFTKWVEAGLPWSSGVTAAPAPSTKKGPPPVNAETMNFWAFRSVRRPAPPKAKNSGWVANPIDAFILAKLEAKRLTPAAPAPRAALIRRAYYDLTGLPPSPEQVHAFVADNSPGAWERVVDRLLASPHYGERWGRHWLDLVRYGETNSFERDNPKPFIWRYRDYVIKSLNDDKPYDQFIREQIAGDEIEHPTSESLIATGYYRLGLWDDEPADPLQARYDELDDLVSTTGQVFLGLTVGCARCHDHKIDPIPQRDYYSMEALFQGTTRYADKDSLVSLGTDEERARFHDAEAAYHAKLAVLHTGRTAIEALVTPDLSPVEKEEFANEQARLPILRKRINRLVTADQCDVYARLAAEEAKLLTTPPPGLEQAMSISESGPAPEPSFIMQRGNPHVPGDQVEPGFLSVLSPPKPDIHVPRSNPNSSGRRLALADWLASPENKLTARVMANRVWQFHFGRGIVRSASNFGFMGDAPTHPELLDWLASELVRDGWKLKPLHKLLMMSNTYRMSSAGSSAGLAIDPTNDLFWRFDMRRLDSEEIRDSILAVNGSLNEKMGGPSIYPPIPAEVLAGQSRPGYGWDVSPPEDQVRRSIYVHVKRSLALPILASFDSPESDLTCPVRFATTQPTQALGMMNSVFLNDQAAVFSKFALSRAGADPAAQVRFVLSRVFQREPNGVEVKRGVEFIDSAMHAQKLSEPAALRYFCLIALNLDEFIYLD